MAAKASIDDVKMQLQLRGLSTAGSLEELSKRLNEATESERKLGSKKRKAEDSDSDSDSDSESSDEFGPMPAAKPAAKKMRKRKVLKHEKLFLKNLPSGQMYERSYMHRDIVTRIVVTATDFVITASVDGHIKFWKKMIEGIDFVKHFKAHLGAVTDLQVTSDGLRLCSASEDKTLKIYDVSNFDMVNMLSLPCAPSCCTWIETKPSSHAKIAVADSSSPAIHVYMAFSATKEPKTLKFHSNPVVAMKYNPRFGIVCSGDAKGVLEYWRGSDYSYPTLTDGISFKYKVETDLFDLAKCRAHPYEISFSAQGDQMLMTSSDSIIRIFHFATGKLRRKYSVALSTVEKEFARMTEKGATAGIDATDFGHRKAVESQLLDTPKFAKLSNAVFDDSGNFIVYATLEGIKVVNIVTNQCVRRIGVIENTERFLHVALFQGAAEVDSQMLLKTDEDSNKKHVTADAQQVDPTVFCTSFNKHRFFLFSTREPIDDDEDPRDVFNEKPTKDEQVFEADTGDSVLGKSAVIRTNYGDIHINLFGEHCPRTVENFSVHSRNGYYDNVVFHRVIKGFMIQTGDPLGDGTGGESIWGGEFEDELHAGLRHNEPYMVSMANAGPNTNGSQFFITLAPTAWLDNKHTIFGRVTRGADVVEQIGNAKVNKDDRPYDDIKILNIEIS